MPVCEYCEESKPEKDFSSSKMCKTCKSRRLSKGTIAKKKISSKAYRENNREYFREKQRKYIARNKEKIRINRREEYWANKEHYNQTSRVRSRRTVNEAQDGYILKLIASSLDMSIDDVKALEIPQEIIDLKRSIVIARRSIKGLPEDILSDFRKDCILEVQRNFQRKRRREMRAGRPVTRSVLFENGARVGRPWLRKMNQQFRHAFTHDRVSTLSADSINQSLLLKRAEYIEKKIKNTISADERLKQVRAATVRRTRKWRAKNLGIVRLKNNIYKLTQRAVAKGTACKLN